MPADAPGDAPNHFATVAAAYASFRPRYPVALYDWLASVAPGRDRVWDCACGSGQATLDLARRFGRVDATDISEEQLALAPRDPRAHYAVAAAEASGLPARSFDLVCVAQALHWFDTARFYAEARRVLRPMGVLAAWSYGGCHLDAAVGEDSLQRFYSGVVGPYWPAGRHHVDNGYRELGFPEPRLEPPALTMALDWTLAELAGYVRSWSATARYLSSVGRDPVLALEAELAPLWGAPGTRHRVRWPLHVHASVVGAP